LPQIEIADCSQVVLVLAPVGRDADIAASIFRTAGIVAQPCQSVSELYERLRAEAGSVGALLLAEESLTSPIELSSLTNWLVHQEPWSDLPIIFLTRPGQPTGITIQRLRVLSHHVAVTVFERPVRPALLVGALRSRERQYQLRDLLESQRRAGIDLQNARLHAEAADRAKDGFLAFLSHELRTPLNAILGWTYLMSDARNDASVIVHGLEVLQRNTRTIIELISDLLDTSRIIPGNMTLDLKDVDLRQVVETSVETLRIQATDKGVTLQSSVEIPQQVSCTVRGDEARLHQIFANLLSNGLKFTPREGSVTVQLRKVNASAVVVVKDTGKGITPELLPHIFERFSQDEASAAENRGLGLGLPICKHLVELHGGSISAESEGLGRGATIKVELPAIASRCGPDDERLGECTFTKVEGMSDTRLSSIKVVAVDDNSDSRELLKAILEKSSAEAVVVSSGQEALAAIKEFHPDVLVCDLAMAEMDGYELLENVQRLEPRLGQTPAIAFTAAASNEDRARSLRAGFRAHLG
jgi:signal transduction histidine kinase/CheY-like chemotaxis protein